MPMLRVRDKAQITLPVTMRRALGIKEGDYLEAEIQGNKLMLTPQVFVAKSEPVALSQQGEQMLEEALDDIEAGRVKEADDVESMIAELHREADLD